MGGGGEVVGHAIFLRKARKKDRSSEENPQMKGGTLCAEANPRYLTCFGDVKWRASMAGLFVVPGTK